MSKLHMCPCGAQPSVMKFGQSWIVECSSCAQNSGAFSTPELAVSRWNKMVAAIDGIVEVRVKRLRENAKLPERKHPGDIGLDLYASEVINYGNVLHVGAGIAVELGGIPVYGYQLRPRSSIIYTGLFMPNSPGTIERTYRGELAANFMIGPKPTMEKARGIYEVGDCFCQLCFPETIDPAKIKVMEVDRLSESERGTDGFGSTNK